GLALVGDAVSVVVGARAVEDVALVAPAVLVAVGADGLGGDDAVDLAGGAGGAVADVDLAVGSLAEGGDAGDQGAAGRVELGGALDHRRVGRAGVARGPDAPRAVVGEEVRAAQLGDRAPAVDVPPGDGAAEAVAVDVEGEDHGVRRGAAGGVEVGVALVA